MQLDYTAIPYYLRNYTDKLLYSIYVRYKSDAIDIFILHLFTVSLSNMYVVIGVSAVVQESCRKIYR